MDSVILSIHYSLYYRRCNYICIDVSLQCITEVDITNTSKLHELGFDKVSQHGKNEFCILTDTSNIHIIY